MYKALMIEDHKEVRDFVKEYFNELYSLKEDQGGRKIVNKYPQECFYFIIENEKELYDIDYQSDLQKLIKEEEYD